MSRRRRSSAALQEVPSSPDSVISARSQASFVSLSITLASDSRSVAGSPIFQLSGIDCCAAVQKERTGFVTCHTASISRMSYLPPAYHHVRAVDPHTAAVWL